MTTIGDDYLYHGFLYVDGKLTTIDFPGAVHTSAQGIDDFGRIVGIFIDDTDTWRGFILVGDKFRAIEAPNAEFTTAVGITGPDIVGDMEINGVSSGYVLRKGRFIANRLPGSELHDGQPNQLLGRNRRDLGRGRGRERGACLPADAARIHIH